MRRIINTFKYGSIGVKLTLLATIICGMATIGLVVCAVLFGQLIWFFGAVFAGFITVSLAQTFGIQAGDVDDDEIEFGGFNDNASYDDSEDASDGVATGDTFVGDFISESLMNPKSAVSEAEEKIGDSKKGSLSKRSVKVKSRSEIEEGREEKKEKPAKVKKEKRNGKTKRSKEETKNADTIDKSEVDNEMKLKKSKESTCVKKQLQEAAIKEAKPQETNKTEKQDKNDIKKESKKEHEKKEHTKKEHTHNKRLKKAVVSPKAIVEKPKKVAKIKDVPAVKSKAKIDINYSAMLRKDLKYSKTEIGKEKEKEKKHEEVVVPEPITSDTVKQYNFRKIRKTLRKFKVKRDHKLAIIDRCEKYNIYQTPAYIWTEKNDFHILLIENEPRHLVLSRMKLGRISYLKKQPVNTNTDYEVFNVKSILTDLFRPYLPDYNQSNDSSDLNYYKNLYGIGQGIFFTNNSAKQLVDIFGFDLDVEDKVTSSKRVNIFFKDVYKANIMVRDNVLDANGYADRISTILEDMAASSISYNEFKDTLNLMIKNKFITKEFGMHFMEVRDKKHS
ncbi:MAG: hypothetical protein IJ763_03945 [Lachnospiraceae bacterium]|nr:hypothetical protein [Lachnospiraceae bacterium]